MSNQHSSFAVGSIVRARGREWIIQPNPRSDVLRLRPLNGTAREECFIIPELEKERPVSAAFELPDPARAGSYSQAVLLRDAVQLKLRNGAGPFRSFGNIAVEPRAYQLVPLLLALKQETVRLLVADDVGVGKTIEAGLILRELVDRAEIAHAAVLAPPHLVDQWVSELRTKFNITAIALTSSSAARIEKTIPQGESLFAHYPFVVVSLDYIKNQRHRENFLASKPDCVIVDEAHTCTSLGAGIQLRWELLKRLAEDPARHMIFLTATPHSGNEIGFYNLLSLLHPDFARLLEGENRTLRERLSSCFVQRRRVDIEEWKDQTSFPTRETSEVTYKLTGEWAHFLDRIRDYCAGIAKNREENRLIWYSTLALLRCSSSSPEAAIRALTARLENNAGEAASDDFIDVARVCDDIAEESAASDLEPEVAPSHAEQTRLSALIETARKLIRQNDDPKLLKLKEVLAHLLKDGYSPVVFCRYIATANYVKNALKAFFPKYEICAVTGELPSEAREEEVRLLAENDKRILVCTDCLSEGINLQSAFDAVVHYDLAWNPTRHEQREGRIDRYGQTRSVVRSVMLFGQDNPVDGFVLNVILKKADKIRRELGVSVPVPLDDERISQAMIKAFILKSGGNKATQTEFDFGETDSAKELATLEIEWTNALEKNAKTRTVFAQRSLHPGDVLPEWIKTVGILGGANDVERFVRNACQALNIPLGAVSSGAAFAFTPQHLDATLRSRLEESGIPSDRTLRISFNPKPLARTQFIHRSHPLVSALADHVFEAALNADTTDLLASRSAVAVSGAVNEATTLLLLRLRHKLTQRVKDHTSDLVAEETCAIAFTHATPRRWLSEDETKALLTAPPVGNLSSAAVGDALKAAFDRIAEESATIDALAKRRAEELLADHRRVRDASGARGSYVVSPVLPVDVIGVYVLLPDEI